MGNQEGNCETEAKTQASFNAISTNIFFMIALTSVAALFLTIQQFHEGSFSAKKKLKGKITKKEKYERVRHC